MVPVHDVTVHTQIIDEIMIANLNDTEQSWKLGADGGYSKITENSTNPFNAHTYFMTNPSLSGRGSARDDNNGVSRQLVLKKNK